jgi:hypothetical protein
MNVSGASFDSALIAQATSLKSGNVQTQISMAVMKQTLDSQQVVADALVEMMSQPVPRIDGTGSTIDIAA